MEPGVRFDGVWKKFRRGQIHDSLRDLIPNVVRRLSGTARPETDLNDDDFWALRDVSFQVKVGEALGIIGTNGAGKSTALKVLTRILKPTRGTFEVHGRIGALIEIAAGFHQDLTGRENIALQGAIMGMPSSLIKQKFDEIVEFSGVADFLDTPVKRYSSGMNARLGFAIAAHLDPEVLIIDEVLAVGDHAFQQRAFGRMRDLIRSGIPVVLVSHQLERVIELCTKVVVLKQGAAIFEGEPRGAVAEYLAPRSHEQDAQWAALGIVLEEFAGVPAGSVGSGEVVNLTVRGQVQPQAAGAPPVRLVTRVLSIASGRELFRIGSDALGVALPASGPFELALGLQLNVPAGVYTLEIGAVGSMTDQWHLYGPSTVLEVRNDSGFLGSVQLNPSMRLLAPA